MAGGTAIAARLRSKTAMFPPFRAEKKALFGFAEAIRSAGALAGAGNIQPLKLLEDGFNFGEVWVFPGFAHRRSFYS